jgi:Obg family GTPase CgtA-like protein
LLDYIVELLKLLPKDISVIDGQEPLSQMPSPGSGRSSRPLGFHIEDGVYVVESEQLERLSARANLNDYRVMLQLWREMSRLGIARKLEEAGIEPGDTIRIGKAEMEWF